MFVDFCRIFNMRKELIDAVSIQTTKYSFSILQHLLPGNFKKLKFKIFQMNSQNELLFIIVCKVAALHVREGIYIITHRATFCNHLTLTVCTLPPRRLTDPPAPPFASHWVKALPANYKGSFNIDFCTFDSIRWLPDGDEIATQALILRHWPLQQPLVLVSVSDNSSLWGL